MGNNPGQVIVQEAGMRDGPQRLSVTMSVDEKKQWIGAAYAAGVRQMEFASFGDPLRTAVRGRAVEICLQIHGGASSRARASRKRHRLRLGVVRLLSTVPMR
jgi:isopropylmalate/homocitrate/citramalate synthase